MMTELEAEEYERLRHSHQGDRGWARWQQLVRKAESVGMVGIPPRLLTGTALPCGFDRKANSFGKRLRHYRNCPHIYCRWRAEVAGEISTMFKGKGGRA
jgi:hypothetical protein